MKSAIGLLPFVKLAAILMPAAALSGVAAALWMENGTAIFLSLAQSGLAWCF